MAVTPFTAVTKSLISAVRHRTAASGCVHKTLPSYSRWSKSICARRLSSLQGKRRRPQAENGSGNINDCPVDVRFGSKANICSALRDVRFTPKSGHVQCTRRCLLWANSGHATYSITSSARASSLGGTVTPRRVAALRLTTNSKLSGSCTGRSAGLAPLRILST